ncbi:CPBP family intramembrane glutamic endopeptidase [Marinibactrum halimedae]|uniref:CPBP family intramembrane glutamic endopeptidase n=1 Tax=Marinibactrum halimedae TaxID=1444977 RepID=UPI001E4D7CA8|nr:CPBP family intramembrane glutamic endopeptidase [Marinibactrum halimedae]MCD9459705.1 CPBP family intramembrane metalloprotease [Marinibactrum halimedae]
MPLLNTLLLLPYCALLYLITYPSSSKLRTGLFFVPTIILGFFIATYRPSGFHYPLVWTTTELYPGGKEFALYANVSKAIAGYLTLAWLINNTNLKQGFFKLGASKEKAIPLIIVSIITILSTALIFFDIQWQPKFSEAVLYFAIINLFFTVISEEVFFRLLLQDGIASFFTNKKQGAFYALIATTLLFTLAHTTAFGPLFFLFLFSGFIYAFAYTYTKSLTVCISIHFGVNLFHFILLEYPL